MKSPQSSREALIAEAIGELGQLLDRVDTLLPAISEVTRQQVEASAQLADQLSDFETQINALGDKVKVHALKQLLALVEAHAVQAMESQTGAMNKAISEAFKAEVDRALQHIRKTIERQTGVHQRHAGRLPALAGCLVAGAAGAITGLLATWPWAR
ncbi:hypothetical protein [Paucibacter sp. DJ2R-2]|uniref:hypothetical protein n=1 Tax=unclassified Roseateles TaxID=2626991 RepID=UPI0021E4FD7C|nr:hypothetical protein [Paucibacter sp. DJ2R-2]MCV2438707.1 hypothetical protein [Paucibacter sp. DJ2R-2]